MANLPTWNLKDFYPDFKSKKIDKDIESLKDKAVAFSKKYKGKLRTLSASNLEISIKEFEKIEEKVQFIHSFAFLTYCTDQTNEEKSKFFQDIEEGYQKDYCIKKVKSKDLAIKFIKQEQKKLEKNKFYTK